MLPGVDLGIDVWSDGSGMPPSKVAEHLFDAASENGAPLVGLQLRQPGDRLATR